MFTRQLSGDRSVDRLGWDGGVVGPNTLELVKNGVRTTLRDSNVAAAVIDDSASTIVYQTLDRTRLFVIDLQTMQRSNSGRTIGIRSRPH